MQLSQKTSAKYLNNVIRNIPHKSGHTATTISYIERSLYGQESLRSSRHAVIPLEPWLN